MSKPDWSKGRIRHAIEKAGFDDLVTLDAHAGLARGATSRALVRPNQGGETAIADAIGVPASVIWPSRYDANGERLCPQPPMNYIEHALKRQRQKSQAA